MQDGIEADFFVQCGFRVVLESLKKHGFIDVVKRIDNLIGKSYESINGINGLSKRGPQETDAHGKRGAVRFGGHYAARSAHIIV